MRSFISLLCAASLAFLCVGASLPSASVVYYTVSLADREGHHIRVRMEFDAGRDPQVDLRLPVWNALYQVQDFAAYVSGVQASAADGTAAPVEKLEKSRWRITPPGPGVIVLQYRVFADRPGPFGAQLDSRHAFINPAQILMYTDDRHRRPVKLRLTDLAAGWKVATALEEHGGAWQARDYDHLADSPFEVSEFQEEAFTAGAGHYRIVVHATPDAYSMPVLRRMLERIVTCQTALMRDVPFARFTFLYHFREGGSGGMEHADSTAIDAPPQRTERDSEALAGVSAHEFFHLWNVKRIRPRSLEPSDYSREQYTRALWFSEGFTSTYGSYTLLRTGLLKPERFLEEVARDIRELEGRPARLFQSLEESSLDAWLEKYGYYGSPERSISYYQKGKLTGFLLDLAIRHATRNRRSLDDVLRYLNERYARAGRFFDERGDIQAAAEAVAGRPFADLFEQLVRTAQPVPYATYLAYAGLELRKELREAANLGFSGARGAGRSYVIHSVPAKGPAGKAGVQAGDELLEINGAAPGDLWRLAEEIRPGGEVRLKLRRNGRQLQARYKAERTGRETFVIVPAGGASPLQERIRAGWLSGKTD